MKNELKVRLQSVEQKTNKKNHKFSQYTLVALKFLQVSLAVCMRFNVNFFLNYLLSIIIFI